MYLFTDQEMRSPAAAGEITGLPRVSTLLEKGSGEMCEDDVLTGRTTYGVFDGATSLVPHRYDARTGGRIAASLCREAFCRESVALAEAAVQANRQLRRVSLGAGVDGRCKEELWSCSAAVVRLEGGRLDWCRLGDCRIVVLSADGRVADVGDTVDHDAETLRSWQARSHRHGEAVLEVMAPEILAVRRRMNIDFGVFNGEPQALDFLQRGSLSLAGVDDVLLFTDGLLPPQRDPGAPADLELLARLYRHGGLQAVQRHVRSLQLADLSCGTYPRFKIHDDIGAVALRFSA